MLNHEDKGSYNFISVYHLCLDGKLQILNPKGLMCMHREKAEGSIKWWRRILADKHFPCFIYDPDEESLFNDDETVNQEKVIELIKRFDGWVSGTDEDPFQGIQRGESK